jgi:hypothetical protein
MQKVSWVAAILLSSVLPGAGLLLVQKGVWFAIYCILAIIGIFGIFFFGLGLFIYIPVWFVSWIHTIVAVMNHNKMAVQMNA